MSQLGATPPLTQLQKSARGLGKNLQENASSIQGSSSEEVVEAEETVVESSTPATEIPQQSKIAEAGDKIKVTIYDEACNAYEKEISRSIEGIRDFIVSNYNWNAIVKIMKFAASKVEHFDYSSPTNIKGTTEDNSIIIPEQGIIAIISAQLQYAIAQNGCKITSENEASILAMVDGLPGAGFASIMGEESQNTLRDEEGNNSMIREDGTEIDIPDFSSDSEETLYDFMRDITLARNGLWSDEKDIVNLTGLRRELEISESEDHEVQWNDTMAASWIEHDDDCNEVKRCKHYTATTEPGNRDSDRMMTPQTATVLLGLHIGRQSAGRVMSPLLKGSDSDNNIYDFDRSNMAGINVHPGGMQGLRGGLGVENHALSGFPGAYGATSSHDVNKQIMLVETFNILSKYGKNRDDSAYSFLKQKADEAQQLKTKGLNISNLQENAISDLKRIDKILEDDVFTPTRKNYIKKTIEFNVDQEKNIFNKEEADYSISELDDKSVEISGTVSGSNVSSSSEGCQVVFGGKSFYDYWWNATNKVKRTGQKKWYYTLINLSEAYEAIETQEGQQ